MPQVYHSFRRATLDTNECRMSLLPCVSKNKIVFALRILRLNAAKEKLEIVSGAASPRSAFWEPDAPRRRPRHRRRGWFALIQVFCTGWYNSLDMEGVYQSDSIFWVEVDRIKPNPFQPRKIFDEASLVSLAESIRSYGVLQPLTVTRKEIERPGEGIYVEYELIAGERRLRAAKIAGIAQVPVVIRTGEDSDRMKLELAIIENLQREDLNVVDRARAFERLTKEFGLKHIDIGKRVGKSREYVSNTLRILLLPQEMRDALAAGEISEGHTRPLLMLMDRTAEQQTLFREILSKRLTVRDSEQVARRVATERVRKGDLTPELLLLERELTEKLGTRVRIEKKDQGGKVLIDFFSVDDLANIRSILSRPAAQTSSLASAVPPPPDAPETPLPESEPQKAQQQGPENDLYSISNFSV